ncbi:MAG: cellulose binding domain-containing protein [Myxococcota bacterium]
MRRTSRNTPGVGVLGLVLVLGACEVDTGDDDAGLFGDGGAQPAPTGDMGAQSMAGSADSAGSAESGGTGADGSSSPSPPPPPPPPPGGDEGSTSGGGDGTEPESSTGTGEDSGTTGEPAGSGSSGVAGSDTFSDGTVDVQVTNQSMFPQGQCDEVVVTNVSAMDVTWEVELPLPGMIDQTWNCQVMEAAGMGTFIGVDFNATLAPGGQAMFGYCVLY